MAEDRAREARARRASRCRRRSTSGPAAVSAVGFQRLFIGDDRDRATARQRHGDEILLGLFAFQGSRRRFRARPSFRHQPSRPSGAGRFRRIAHARHHRLGAGGYPLRSRSLPPRACGGYRRHRRRGDRGARRGRDRRTGADCEAAVSKPPSWPFAHRWPSLARRSLLKLAGAAALTPAGAALGADEGAARAQAPLWTSSFAGKTVWGYVDKHSVAPGEGFDLMLATGPMREGAVGRVEFLRIGAEGDRRVWASP